ncbi:hypothetical protein NLJ89_g4479 [Agrocybe chaxingu]|uniref:Uncharacterized protein n=1 Tax=Agrocybe chaxingu TaxID=84603 RepID=A0A9W8MWH6_9AGAR|nr:hypothetical protein NLJ89_g4479 [Agrocybe chaxingu]
MINTVNNYFANFPGQSSTSHQGVPPPSRSGLASITDIAEDESVGTSGRGTLRGVRFSEDAQAGRQKEWRRRTYVLAYEYDMDAPGGIDANFNNSKTIPEKIRTYMRSDFFDSKRSIALWTPSPGVNHDPRITKKNIAIGDVGIFTVQGGFEVFFNIFMTKEDNQEYGYHPPPDFTPCAMVANGSIHKDSLIESNLVRGSWYRYYRSPISGPMLPTGSLKIVSTTYKTGTWAYAVGMKDLTTQDKRLFANLARPDEDEDVFKWKQHSQDVSVNTGPSTVEMDGGKATLINQCVAVEVFAIKPTPLLSAPSFLAFAPMSKFPVAYLTPPSSATSPEFSLDSPDVILQKLGMVSDLQNLLSKQAYQFRNE